MTIIMMMNCFSRMVGDSEMVTIGNKVQSLSSPTILEKQFIVIMNAASRILTCVEPEFRLCLTTLRSNDNHFTTVSMDENVCSLKLQYWTKLLVESKKLKQY